MLSNKKNGDFLLEKETDILNVSTGCFFKISHLQWVSPFLPGIFCVGVIYHKVSK